MDKELEELLEAERLFKKACELHRQYETNIIWKRVAFQENCPHLELKESIYIDPILGGIYKIFHCKRCNKLIKREKINDKMD